MGQPAQSESTGNEITERFAKLVETFSQAEIARKTKTQRMNITRYMRGTRMPADFCAALTRELNVNPTWLLTGEGSTYLSDVSATQQALTSDITDLIKAMNSVTRHKLGTANKQPHTRALRDLSDAIQSFQSLKAELGTHGNHSLENLLDQLSEALKKEKSELAATLVKICKDVASICDDTQLTTRYLALRAQYEMLYVNAGKAIDLQRKAFEQTLMLHGVLHKDTLHQASSLHANLVGCGRAPEARRLVRAVREFVRGTSLESDWSARLGIQESISGFESGDIDYLDTFFAQHFATLSPNNKTGSSGFMLTGMFYRKTLPIESLFSEPPHSQTYSLCAVRCAIIEESVQAIDFVTKQFVGRGQFQISKDYLSAQHVLSLQKVLAGNRKGHDDFEKFAHAERYRDRIPSHLVDLVATIYGAQLARLAGNTKHAIKRTLEAQELIEKLGDGVTPQLWLRVIHARNALGLSSQLLSSAKNWARGFLEAYAQAGYHFLGDILARPTTEKQSTRKKKAAKKSSAKP